MYKIIGADQKEYGPVSGDQIRQWIRDGRVNGNTQARPESGGGWQALSSFPEFADAFQPGAAAPSSAPPSFAPASPFGSNASALQAVKGPAIALIVMASLGIALYLLSALAHIVRGQAMSPQMANLPPQAQAYMRMMVGPLGTLIDLVAVALNVVVLFGAIKMMRLQSYGLAMVACILAMLPVASCCCLIGLPFGIWGLIVLNKPEVKSQFT